MTTRSDEHKLATDVPDPPTVTEQMRAELAAEAREWRADLSRRASAMEAVTSKDLRARAR
jgi:hypothetical protein